MSIRKQIVKIPELELLLTEKEKKLAKFFKCPFKDENCFFTTDLVKRFLKHMKLHQNHKEFKCIYCDLIIKQNNDSKEEFIANYIAHINDNHFQRIFQCNLCIYRAIKWEYVLIHQIICHPEQRSV